MEIWISWNDRGTILRVGFFRFDRVRDLSDVFYIVTGSWHEGKALFIILTGSENKEKALLSF
ncbi:MAG: hypothetical protein GX061_03650 [Eubacteriaceae bacterium]|nr:hypothetical protein [Eubacteriaceae bacterium]